MKLKTAFTVSQPQSVKVKKKEVLEKVIRASYYLQVEVNSAHKPLVERSRGRYDLRIRCQDIDLVAAVYQGVCR